MLFQKLTDYNSNKLIRTYGTYDIPVLSTVTPSDEMTLL